MDTETNLLDYTIVIINNDESTCEYLTSLLVPLGVKTMSYLSAHAFLEAFDKMDSKLLLLPALSMSEISGMMLQKLLKLKLITLPIIFIAEQPNLESVVQAMQNGAFSVLTKPLDEANLIDNIKRAIQSHQKHLHQYQQQLTLQSKFSTLSDKERTILALITDGLANKNIAKKLSISIKTVEYHRNNLRQKLNAKSFAELIKLSLQYQQSELTD